MRDDGLPPLRDIIARYQLQAGKHLGQNFIFDFNLTRRIARAAKPHEKTHIIEIGAGPGGLTRALLIEGAQTITAIEADARFQPALSDIQAAYPNQLEVIIGDAREYKLPAQTAYKIVANLPYNAATALLLLWLRESPNMAKSMTLMFQKEVGERICAAPNSPHYGRLAVLANWLCQTKILFDVPPQAFVPQPKIASCLVQLIPRNKPYAEAERQKLEKVTQAAFGQRRKMLRTSLKQISKDPVALLQAAQIDPTARAETLTIDEFCALARLLD